MNPYIGDRQLDPDEEPDRPTRDCEPCGGWGWLDHEEKSEGCPHCNGTGQVEITDEELAQQQFDDFDPPDNDFGEPL